MNTPDIGTLPMEHCAEYDGAAEYFARHGKLPILMGSPGALDWIESDPEAFEERVRGFKRLHAEENRPPMTASEHSAFPQGRFGREGV